MQVYQGEMPVQKYPNHYYNDWPSDHRAVFTDFQVMPSAADDDEWIESCWERDCCHVENGKFSFSVKKFLE